MLVTAELVRGSTGFQVTVLSTFVFRKKKRNYKVSMKVGVDLTQPVLFKTTAMFVFKCLFLCIWLSRVSAIVACGILAF